MTNFKKKLFLLIFAIIICVGSFYKLYLSYEGNQNLVQKLSLMNNINFFNTKEENEKLVTLLATFMENPGSSDSEYRYLAQTNFLRMTSFDSLRENVNFLVFTNSRTFKQQITSDYPHVRVIPCPTRGDFNAPMLKELFLTAQKIHSSYFYMFANADNLYDSGLLKTLSHVKKAWLSGLIRQKILIVGQRHNIVVQGPVENETVFKDYFEKSSLGHPNAEDYFIVTKDSFEWLLYPEVIIGRRAYDNMLVDFSVHNEVVLIDATATIRTIHQSEVGNEASSSAARNAKENSWNFKMAYAQFDLWSPSCGRYETKLNEITNRVDLYDKKTGLVLDLSAAASDSFANEHKHWLVASESKGHAHSDLTPSLLVVVLAYNKPDSLRRLLDSLENVGGNSVVRIDLVISLDLGHSGFYDLPTLMIAKKFEWTHGRKEVVLKDTHRGQLHQWLEASRGVESSEDTRLLILEDCMVLSPRWYEYMTAVLEHDSVMGLQDKVAGWSLEIPIPWQSNDNSVRAFYEEYAKKSSLVLAGIKRVRSFIPNLKIWKGFIEWFMKESGNVSIGLLSDSLAARLENRGSYTNWESEMWITWYSYYLKMKDPLVDTIVYIVKRSGSVCEKMQKTILDFEWVKKGGCYSEGVVTSEIQGSTISEENDPVLIPEVLPRFNIEPVV